MVRRELLQQLHGFDERSFISKKRICSRIWKSNSKVVFIRAPDHPSERPVRRQVPDTIRS